MSSRPNGLQERAIAWVMAGITSEGAHPWRTVEACVRRGWLEYTDAGLRTTPTTPGPCLAARRHAWAEVGARREARFRAVWRAYMRLDREQRREFVRKTATMAP